MSEKPNVVANIDNIKLQELLDIIFKEVAIPIETTDHTPEYPESLLQQTQKANKYYNSFQGLTKQFIDESIVQSDVVRWSNSIIQLALKSIVKNWQTVDVQGTAKSIEQENGDENRASIQTTANTLFSWSSGDSYIESRKKELQFRNSQPNNRVSNNGSVQRKKDIPEADKHIDTNSDDIKKKLNLELPKESITNKLNRIVDRESNKFIHRRIQLIKAHHSEQISKEIHERKRKDHERHLNKLKEKEEEYERALQAATGEQVKQNGFFGSLFGFNVGSNNNPHNMSLPPEIDNKSLGRDMTSSPSGKNKRFSFLPTAGLSLWGSTTSSNKSTRQENAPPNKTDFKNPVSKIHGTYSNDIIGEAKGNNKPESAKEVNVMRNQNTVHDSEKQSTGERKDIHKKEIAKREGNTTEETNYSNKHHNEPKDKGEDIDQNGKNTSHSSKNDYDKKDSVDEQGQEEDEDEEFEEYNSSLPNFSIIQEPIQPTRTGTKKSTNSANDKILDNDNLLEL